MATGIANQVSARNQLNGTIAEIRKGAAMSVVTVSAHGHTITSAITNQAVQDLGLRQHDSVIALVKATEGIIAKGDAGAMKISARNKISGRITDIEKGSAMATGDDRCPGLETDDGDYPAGGRRSAIGPRRPGDGIFQVHRGAASKGMMLLRAVKR